MTPKNNINPKPTFLKHFYLLCIFLTCYTCIKAHRLGSCPWLKNTRPYMSHLKAKIKRQDKQKKLTKVKGDREWCNALFGFMYKCFSSFPS